MEEGKGRQKKCEAKIISSICVFNFNKNIKCGYGECRPNDAFKVIVNHWI